MSVKTKQILYCLLMAGVLIVGASGCSKGDREEREPESEKPAIQNLVIGKSNSKTVYLGDKLVVEADIIARGKISRVLISINSLDATPPVGISTALERNLKDKTEAHLSWEALMDDVPTGKYRFTMTVEAKVGETGQITSELNVQPK
ncbi:MAG: hypothetical protein ABI288_04620 [Ginsengibacter sp.]